MLREMKTLKTETLTSGETKSIEIPRVMVSKKFQLRFKITATHTALSTGNTYGTVDANAPASLIKQIELTATGGGNVLTLKNASGIDLLKQNTYLYGGGQELVDGMPSGTTTVAGTSSTSYFSCDLNFSIPDAKDVGWQESDSAGNKLMNAKKYNPRELTLLNPTLFSYIELKITVGSLTDVRAGTTAGVLTLGTVTVDVITEDLPEVKLNSRFFFNRELYKQTTNTGASTDTRIDLPKGNMIRQILVQAVDNSAFSNSLINNLKVVVNENITRLNIGFNQLRNENSKQFGVPFASLLTGVALIDFDGDGDLQGLLDVTAVDNVRLVVDNQGGTGTTYFRILTQEIVTPAF